MNEFQNILIFPVVREFFRQIVQVALFALIASSITALAEPVLALVGLLPLGVFAGVGSEILFAVFLGCLGLLLPWCHHVLVAVRGVVITRWLSCLAPLISLLLWVNLCSIYVFHTPLIPAELPGFYLSFLLIVCFSINWFHLAALRTAKRVRIISALVCILLIANFQYIPHFIFALCILPLKIAVAILLVSPLKALEKIIPLIISLPDENQPADVE